MSKAQRNQSSAGYVGFANLPNQVHRRMVKKGFEFTLMLVGESGLGKSTLVSSLFLIDKQNIDRPYITAAEKANSTVTISPTEVQIEERGVRLKLTVVDTPGFSDNLDCNDQQAPISDYIDSQFQQYLDNESGLNRRNITDSRVHCCFYFLSPHSNGLRPVDIEFMKSLHHKVNIVPLLAKADTLTPFEIRSKKQKILEDIAREQIRIYQLPDVDEDEDPNYKAQLESLKAAVPFAVVGSTETYEVNGKKIRGRLYPWGVVEIENPKHSEFTLLRNMLITHMQDLQEVTHDLHYENYRAQVLTNNSTENVMSNPNVLASGSLAGRSASNMASPPSQDVIADKEAEIQRMKEMMAKMQMELQMQQQGIAPVHYNNGSQQQGGNYQHAVPTSINNSMNKRRGPPPPPRKPSTAGGSQHLEV